MVQMSEELMMKFIANTCTDDELATVKSWLDESDENAAQLFELEKVAMLAGTLRDDSEDRARVARDIKLKIATAEMQRRRNSRRKLTRWISAAAAVVAVAATAAVFLQRPDVRMLTAVALNESRSVTLPDGSVVYLNTNSELRYPETFASTRKVSLSGEGFFKVTRDTEHPFVVEGRYIDVEVLGTEFNFNSNENGVNNVSLVEGSVEVSRRGSSDGVVLAPGQKAAYDVTTGNLTVVATNAPVDAAWHDKVIPFDNVSIQGIADILMQLYEVDIHLNENVDTQKTYSGATIFHKNIDSTLARLANTLPIKYHRAGNSIEIISKTE